MWQEIGCGVDIHAFLKQHNLISGNEPSWGPECLHTHERT